MKKLLAAAAIISLTIGASHAGQKDWSEVRIGVEGAYPPFSSMTPDGDLVGFDIDIAAALCAQMGVECTLVAQDWDGIIPALLANKYDAIIASMSITEERKKKVDFTDRYYNSPAKFVRRKGSGIEITAEGLDGKTVGVQRATTHDNYLSDVYADTVEIKRYGTQDEAYLDMKAGRLDLLLADSVAMDEGFLQVEGNEDFEFVGPDLADPQWFGEGAGIAIRQDDDELREMFNAAIVAIRENGVYKSIQDKYFDFNIYGD
jgi:arginine/ornithine transport system substrate-binding protein